LHYKFYYDILCSNKSNEKAIVGSLLEESQWLVKTDNTPYESTLEQVSHVTRFTYVIKY